MFYDRPDCIKLAEQVYVFKNYIPEEMRKPIEEQLNAVEKEKFKYEESLINWYVDKVSPIPDGIHTMWEHVSDLIYPEYVIHPMVSLLTIRPGDGGMFIHSDSPGKGCEMELSQLDVWSTCCLIDYGMVGYLGDFTGGAVFYPNIHPDGTIKEDDFDGPCLEYTPEPGDIVIHSALHPYNHGVREVESGIRYAFSNFVLKAEDNPGTFHNYKSEGYNKFFEGKTIDKELLNMWMQPFYESATVRRLLKEKAEKEAANNA